MATASSPQRNLHEPGCPRSEIPNPPSMLTRHEISIRVRYQETDAQGRVHHASYLGYFEQGRVEMLRASGLSYRQLEAEGFRLVVVELTCRYYLPAEFDDLLTLETTVLSAKGARVTHRYRLVRGEQLLVEGHSIVACIDGSGKVRRLPALLRRTDEPDSTGDRGI
jgi:acyl-CoA thioester hydrolase